MRQVERAGEGRQGRVGKAYAVQGKMIDHDDETYTGSERIDQRRMNRGNELILKLILNYPISESSSFFSESFLSFLFLPPDDGSYERGVGIQVQKRNSHTD